MKRVIDTTLWEDSKWRKEIKSPKARLLWLYLLTCPSSKSIGIFHLDIDKVAFDTRLDEDEVKQFLMQFTDLEMCIYNIETEEIIIWNYPIYNICSWGKPMQDKIRSELGTVDNNESIRQMQEHLNQFVKTHPQDKRAELMFKVVELFNACLEPIKERETLKESKSLSKSNSNNNSISNSNYNDTVDVSCQEEQEPYVTNNEEWDNLLDKIDEAKVQ